MKYNSFEKHCVFITSLGRTGTKFFGQYLGKMIEDCTSVHEPDVLAYRMPVTTYRRIREFGLFRMTTGKLLPHQSIRGLGIAKLKGTISDDVATKDLRSMRHNILKNLKTKVYLEANYQCSLLVDTFPLAFPNSKTVFVLRDPRSWVSSWMNTGGSAYSRWDLRSWFKNTRLTPSDFKGDPCIGRWNKMTRFEKLCWVWSTENAYVLDCAEKTDKVRIFRFEDLFNRRDGYKSFLEMLEFITDFPDGFKAEFNFESEVLEQKTNSSDRSFFPPWKEWGHEDVKILDEHCGKLMRRFNYGNESDWLEKIE